MAFRFPFIHPDWDMMHLEQMRDVIAQSRELLAKNPVPDTFVGRKDARTVSPREDQTERAELQPPE
jgi:hypothetical protein